MCTGVVENIIQRKAFLRVLVFSSRSGGFIFFNNAHTHNNKKLIVSKYVHTWLDNNVPQTGLPRYLNVYFADNIRHGCTENGSKSIATGPVVYLFIDNTSNTRTAVWNQIYYTKTSVFYSIMFISRFMWLVLNAKGSLWSNTTLCHLCVIPLWSRFSLFLLWYFIIHNI